MKNKKNITTRNPLLIPFIVAVVIAAFFGGLSLNKGFNSQFEGAITQPTSFPKTTPNPTDVQVQNATKTNTASRKAIVIPISNKTVYCVESGYDAVSQSIQGLNDAIKTADSLLAEQDRCNNSCRERTNEILESCKSAHDEEACIKECSNNCLKLVEGRLNDEQAQIKEKATLLNKVAGQYCTN